MPSPRARGSEALGASGVWQRQGPWGGAQGLERPRELCFVLKAVVGRGQGGKPKVLGEGAGESRDTARLSLQKGDPGPPFSCG